jgi:hypothetical protein
VDVSSSGDLWLSDRIPGREGLNVQVADLILVHAPQGFSRSHLTLRMRHSTHDSAGLRRRFAGPLPSVSARWIVGRSTILNKKPGRGSVIILTA